MFNISPELFSPTLNFPEAHTAQIRPLLCLLSFYECRVSLLVFLQLCLFSILVILCLVHQEFSASYLATTERMAALTDLVAVVLL